MLNYKWLPKNKTSKNVFVATYGTGKFIALLSKSMRLDPKISWLCKELPPVGLSETNIERYNYHKNSSRLVDISSFNKLVFWLSSVKKYSFSSIKKVSDGYYDILRPNLEPNPFTSKYEAMRLRNIAVNGFFRSIKDCNNIVFELGAASKNIVDFDTTENTFKYKVDLKSLEYSKVFNDAKKSVQKILSLNPNIQNIIFCITPEDSLYLKNSCSHEHILYEKSLLRLVLKNLSEEFGQVSYFPLSEILYDKTNNFFVEARSGKVNLKGYHWAKDVLVKALLERQI